MTKSEERSVFVFCQDAVGDQPFHGLPVQEGVAGGGKDVIKGIHPFGIDEVVHSILFEFVKENIHGVEGVLRRGLYSRGSKGGELLLGGGDIFHSDAAPVPERCNIPRLAPRKEHQAKNDVKDILHP